MATSSTLSTSASPVLSVARIVVGFMFFCHGAQKILGLFGGLGGHAVPIPTMPGVTGLLEMFGGLLVMVGLFTRPTAVVLSGEMAVAYFLAHASSGKGLLPIQNGGEPAVLYCFFFLLIAFIGPGVWSVDERLRRRI
jgi:putative oxidoreductase